MPPRVLEAVPKFITRGVIAEVSSTGHHHQTTTFQFLTIFSARIKHYQHTTNHDKTETINEQFLGTLINKQVTNQRIGTAGRGGTRDVFLSIVVSF